jgi:hypothetical protein
VGEILFELRDDSIYYIWTLHRVDGVFLGRVSRAVSFRVIPNGIDPIEYVLNHALNGINNYRMGRRKAFQVNHWQWNKFVT